MRRLLIPLVLVVLALTVAAQVQVTGGIGPTHPILMDTNGNGKPDAGDTPIAPVYVTNTIGGVGNFSTLSFPNPCGTTPASDTFQLISKTNGKWSHFRRVHGTQTTDIVFTTFVGGSPTGLSITDVSPNHQLNGTGQVLDQNSDGIFDAIGGVGGVYNVLIGLLFADTTGDGIGDFVSIPWSLSSQIAVPPGKCGSNAQVWVPVADTNGDGKPDRIVLDLNGDGVPDPDFFEGPVIGPAVAAVAPGSGGGAPTLSQWGIILLTSGLAFVGWWYLRSQNLLG